MNKESIKNILDAFMTVKNGYKLVNIKDDKLSENKNEPNVAHNYLETSDVSINLNFNNGKPNIKIDTKKHLTKI